MSLSIAWIFLLLVQVYNVDAIAYESVLVGLFSIYSGVLKPPSGPSAMQWQGDEHNELHLGFSRDSFFFHRPSPEDTNGRCALITSLVFASAFLCTGMCILWSYGCVYN